MIDDPERCYRAVQAKDPRFDGMFVTAVRTTGIYCRPSCPAITPRRANVTFHPTAAAAQQAGFRACKRCRPDAAPGSPEWDRRADAVARAVRMIDDGVVDRDGVPALAHRLGYSERQLHRLLTAELGTGPLALARARRAVTARMLVETTGLSLAQVAFAAGFGSVRQFNETVRAVFDASPGDLRRAGAGRRGVPAAPGEPAAVALPLRLAVRTPFTPSLAHLVATGVPGVESWAGGAYHRSVRLPHGPAVVSLRPAPDHVAATVHLADLRDLAAAVARCRFLLDLDADPVAVDEILHRDPVLRPLLAARPGLRVPRTVDGGELALRAVLGQQVATAAARTHAGRLVTAAGDRLPPSLASVAPGVTHLFPRPAAVLAAVDDPSVFRVPGRRRTTIRVLASRLASGELDLAAGADRAAALRTLATVPGVGPWTLGLVAMRALGDPDVLLATDLGVRRAAAHLGLPGSARRLEELTGAWRPWRAYATQHLWAVLPHPVNHLPEEQPCP